MGTHAGDPGPPREAPSGSVSDTRPGLTSPRAVTVRLDWQPGDAILVVTAATPKKGTSRSDRWSLTPSLALTYATVVDASAARRPCYVSRAVVDDASLVADTTYVFSYAIVMRAGTRTWVGSGRLALTVGSDGSLPGVASRRRRSRS